MIIDHHVGSWDQFVQLVEGRSGGGDQLPARCIFRGQGSSEWPLETTLERAGLRDFSIGNYYRMISRVKPQVETLLDQRFDLEDYSALQRMLESYDSFGVAMTGGRLPGYSYLLFLRHHGFPSPILDWTRSPYVAAYFAFAKSQPEWTRCVIYAVDFATMQAGGSDTTEIYNLGPYVRTDARHFRQQCEYTICVRHQEQWQFGQHADGLKDDPTLAPDTASHFQHRIWRIHIPFSERTRALAFLDRFNLNAYSLFGSTDSLISTLADRELRDFLG